MIDSGAFDTISPMELVGGNDVRETEMSKNKECYSACNGTKVKSKGCTTIEAESDEGLKVKFVSQIGEGVKKMLISVRRAVESGNMIIFGANAKAIKSREAQRDRGQCDRRSKERNERSDQERFPRKLRVSDHNEKEEEGRIK